MSRGRFYNPQFDLFLPTIVDLKFRDQKEHFVGYPYVLSMLYRLAGYTPDFASAFNVFAASFGCVLIFLVAMAATESAILAVASSLVFAITPVFAVYGLETSAEPASNACIILVIWFVIVQMG
jgi:hypothetical protein